MSDESDLEFESADEGLKGEDIDTDDLIEDDENVVEKKVIFVKAEGEQTEKKETDLPHTKIVEIDSEKEIAAKLEETRLVNDDKTQTKVEENVVKLEKKEGWDADAEFSDLEDEKVDVFDAKSSAALKDEQKPSLVAKQESASAKTTAVKEKSGWDVDADFSDVDEETEKDDGSEAQLKAEEPTVNKDIRSIGLFSQEPKQQESSWSSGWGSFGSNILSKATSLTSQLNSGINTVLETVEATIGAPDPLQLAKLNLEETEALRQKKMNETTDEKNQNDWIEEEDGAQEWFSMGTQLVSGGLDVLETVGRKTFQVINDKDQNLKQTREFLSKVPSKITAQKPNLSQLLREAKESKVSSSRPSFSDDFKSSHKSEANSFCYYFDEFVGSVHLEALEMLSRQCNVKLEVLAKPQQLRALLSRLDGFFNADKLNDENENEKNGEDPDADADSFFGDEEFLKDFESLVRNKTFDPDRFEVLINQYGKRLHFFVDLEKIVKAFRTATTITTQQIGSPIELLNESIKCFALTTSRIIEFYHKAAECILVEQGSSKKTQNCLDNTETIYQITKLCLRSITIVAEDFCKKCRTIAKDMDFSSSDKSCNQIIADIYLESSNSCTFTSDAYVLLEPVIKSRLLEE